MGAEIMTDEWDHLPGDGELAWLGAVICAGSAVVSYTHLNLPWTSPVSVSVADG